MKAIKFIGLLLMMCLTLNSQAQDHLANKNRLHYIGVTFNQAFLGLPFSERISKKNHPGVSLFYEFTKDRQGIYEYSNAFQLSYFYHENLLQYFSLSWRQLFGLDIANTVNFFIPLGLGYAVSFPTQTSYEFGDGKYDTVNPATKSHFRPSLGMGVSLKMKNIIHLPIVLTASYEMIGLFPYAIKGVLPITMHRQIGVGFKYQIQ